MIRRVWHAQLAVPSRQVCLSERPTWRRLLGWLQALAVICAAGGATPIAAVAESAALPADLAAAIDRAAAHRQTLLTTELAAYARLNNPQLQTVAASQTRARADAVLAGVVIGTIAQRPDLAAAIVARAEAAAPRSSPMVRAIARSAYPGLFDGAAGAAQIRPPRQGWYDQANLAAYAAAPGAASLARSASPPALVAARYNWYDQPVLRRYRGVAATAYQPQISVSQPAVPAIEVSDQIPQPDVPADTPEPERTPQLTPPGEPRVDVVWDPLEPVNTAIFSFNEVTDVFILRPIAWFYSFTPTPIKTGVANVFDNLDLPVIFLNDLLQGDFNDAAVAGGRFVVNSTVGVIGVFDVADDWFGWPAHYADFGQTLHAYGVGAGPYLVLPLLGPSNLRDSVGTLADYLMDPFRYLLPDDVYTGLRVAGGVVTREQLLQSLDILRSGSLDYYVSLRSAYYQNRKVELAKGRLDAASDVDQLFDDID